MSSQKESICNSCGELIEDCICDQEELEVAAEVYDKAVQDEEAFGYFRGDDQEIAKRTRHNEKRRQDVFDRYRATAEAEEVADECLDC